jgi:alanine dehydrogenase
MIVGVPKETKPREGRVGIVPAGVGELARGLNVCDGHVTLRPVAKLFGLQHVPLERILAER